MVTRQAAAKKIHTDVGTDGSLLMDKTLPAGVVDIDLKDLENPQLCAEYTQDMYAYLRLVCEFLAILSHFMMNIK